MTPKTVMEGSTALFIIAPIMRFQVRPEQSNKKYSLLEKKRYLQR
jgi:hypothetical protein